MFPHGELGWHPNLRQNDHPNAKRMTLNDYFAFKIMRRENTWPDQVLSGQLFQQYCVDMSARAEGQRLNYLRFNQKQLRQAHLSGIRLYPSLHVQKLTYIIENITNISPAVYIQL